MNIRAEQTAVDPRTIARLRAGRADQGEVDVRESLPMGRAAIARLKARPPLVLQYAPAEHFAEARRQYEAQQKRPPSPPVETNEPRTCADIYVTRSVNGFYNGFTSRFCYPVNAYPPYVWLWEFKSIADYTDDDSTIHPAVAVSDDNGNFNCYQEFYEYTSAGSCTASEYTQLLQQGCLNDVDTGALLYHIEYLEGYVPSYTAFTFLVDYCTYFY